MFEEEDNGLINLASTMASVSESGWEDNIDANVHAAFSVPPSVEQHSSPSSDVSFCKSMNLRGDLSKISASIGSCNVSSELCSVVDIEKPSFSKWEIFESTLKLVINPEELEHIEDKVSCTQVSRFREDSKEVPSNA